MATTLKPRRTTASPIRYWIIQVRSKEEALEWAKRIPFGTEVHPGQDVEVELRQVFEFEQPKH